MELGKILSGKTQKSSPEATKPTIEPFKEAESINKEIPE
jgi:hypothetical protein